MKLAHLFLIVLALVSLVSSTRRFSRARVIDNKSLPIYSMVWSAKSYTTTGKEEKKFFFAIPFSFNTKMKVNIASKSINFDFESASSDAANFNVVKQSAPIVQSSGLWKDFVKFSADFKKIDLDFNQVIAGGKLQVSRIKLYQNQEFRNVQIKFTKATEDKFKNALYVTFDIHKKSWDEKDISAFVEGWKTYFPQAKVTTGTR
jgi:hypothetical protein